MGDTMDELNAMAKDLDWAERLRNTENYLHPEQTKKKGFRGWGILIAFVFGLALSSMIFYWRDPITEWITGVLGL